MLRPVLLFLLILFVARAFWRVVDGVIEGLGGRTSRTRSVAPGVPMVKDPNCGTFVVPSSAVVWTEGRRQLHFCSTACRDAYRARTA
jgi:hypothetical protein